MRFISFKLTLFLALINLLFRCNSEQEVLPEKDIESFVFGHSYGECRGPGCVETYKIMNKTLFRDTLDQYGYCTNSSFNPNSFIAEQDSNYQKVKALLHFIPTELWDYEEGTIGMPDSYDQGGLQVQISTKSTTKCWFIDMENGNTPPFIHSFVDSTKAKLRELAN